MRRGDAIKSYPRFIFFPFLLPLLQVDAFLLTLFLVVLGLVILITPPKVSQEFTTTLQLKVHRVYVV